MSPAWDCFGYDGPPRQLLHGHRCDVCRRDLTLMCQCPDADAGTRCETCEAG